MIKLLNFAFLATLASAEVVRANSLKLEISGLKSPKGTIEVFVYTNSEGFPTDIKKTKFTYSFAVNSEPIQTIEIKDLPSDTAYAISVYHDTNDNKKLDTSFVGIPKEPVGVSNNAKGRFGPPTFKDAVFIFKPNSKIMIKLE